MNFEDYFKSKDYIDNKYSPKPNVDPMGIYRIDGNKYNYRGIPNINDAEFINKETYELLKLIRKNIDDDAFRSIFDVVGKHEFQICPVRVFTNDKKHTATISQYTFKESGDPESTDYYVHYYTRDEIKELLFKYLPVSFDNQKYVSIEYYIESLCGKYISGNSASVNIFNDGSIYVGNSNFKNCILNIIPQDYHAYILSEVVKFINKNKNTNSLNQVEVYIPYCEKLDHDKEHVRIRKHEIRNINSNYWYYKCREDSIRSAID